MGDYLQCMFQFGTGCSASLRYRIYKIQLVMMEDCMFFTDTYWNINKEIDEMLSISDGIVFVDKEAIRRALTGANNLIFSLGVASGTNRVTDAIENAVYLACKRIWSEYDYFSAKKVVLQLSYSERFSLTDNEISSLLQFAEMFPSETSYLWNIYKDHSISDDTVIATVIATELQDIPPSCVRD
jgi:cell division protein FtsZ